MTRGRVVPLTTDQIITRALYLAGKATLGQLDEHVRKEPMELRSMGYTFAPGSPGWALCPDLFYLLKDHNGGKDPTAPDPADRWSSPGSAFVNRTADCVGGASWCSGFDRYQPERFAHLYDGWINTNSSRIDAGGPKRCFERVHRPEPGTMIVCASGSPGHAVGHVGIVVAYHGAEWDPTVLELWDLIDVVDVAARGGRANKQTTGRGWSKADGWFLRSTMT